MLLGINPSETKSSFCVCGDRGFAFYSSDPIKFKFGRDFTKGISHAEQWLDSNIVVLVGGGKDPMFPIEEVVVWNDHKQEIITKKTFESDVKRILVTHNRVIKMKFPPQGPNNTLTEESQYPTFKNTLGCVSILNYSNRNLIAIPSDKIGFIRLIKDVFNSQETTENIPVYYTTPIESISLFDNSQQKMKMLAISTDGGCYIDVWDISKTSNSPMVRFSRSLSPSLDVSFGWDPTGEYLCVCSSNESIHYFDLKNYGTQGYLVRGNFAKYKVKLLNEGGKGYMTRCWFTRKSSRLIVCRIEVNQESAFYEIYKEVSDTTKEPMERILLYDQSTFSEISL